MIPILILTAVLSLFGGPKVTDTSSGTPTMYDTSSGTPTVSAFDTSSGTPTHP